MEHVLLNTHKLNEPWLFSFLYEYLNEDKKVLYFILDGYSSFSDDYRSIEDIYQKGSKDYDELVMPLLTYKINQKNISFLFRNENSLEKLKEVKDKYDVLILYGNNEIYFLEKEYEELLKDYKGLVIGINEGSNIQFEEYYRFDEDTSSYEGLGLLKGFVVDISYKKDEIHLENIIRLLEEKYDEIVCLPDSSGGFYISEGYIELLGEAFILKDDNMDELYEELETLRRW